MAENYTVVSQRPVTAPGPTGNLTPAIEVEFTTKPSGQPGKVRIPENQFTPAHVDDVLTKQADAIETVQAL